MNARRGPFVFVCIVVVIFLLARARADFTVGEPVNLRSVIPVLDPAHELVFCFSYDGLEMYINRAPGLHDSDLYRLRRTSRDEDWGPPESLGLTVNSPDPTRDDSAASISPDGLALYFHSNRPGGQGGEDLYLTTRAAKNEPWGTPVNLGPKVNSSSDEAGAWISADGLELYFHSWRPGGNGKADIWVARRATPSEPWTEAVNLGPMLNSANDDVWPCVSPDGLVLFFCAYDRVGGYGGEDIWQTRRATPTAPWQTPRNLGAKINLFAYDDTPRVSPDGGTLYFSTAETMDRNTWENWQAPVLPAVDFNADGKVDIQDLLRMIESWGKSDQLVDIGPYAWGDGKVDEKDLETLMGYWGREVNDPTLVAHWKLDEKAGTVVSDSAGNNHAAIIGNAGWQPEGGKVGGALQLSGVANFAMTGFVLNPANPPFSVFAWVKGGAPGQVILSQAGGVNWLLAQPGTGFLMSDLKVHPLLASVVSQAVVTDGAWHRVGFVWDGANRILYVEGVEAAKGPQSALPDSTGGLYFGAGSTPVPGTLWSGLIDDVRVYNRDVKP
jgi:hypothetical protein